MSSKQRSPGPGTIDLLAFAIQRKLALRCTYKDERREIEPHTLGVTFARVRLLRAWQRSGGSGEGWRLFRVAEMTEIELVPGLFFSPRPGYVRGDLAMQSQIDCEI